MRRVLVILVAAVLLALPAVVRPAVAATGQVDGFFATAILPQSAFPRGMVDAGSGPITQDQVASNGGAGAADELAADGFQGAYGQSYRTTSITALLTGQPAGAGDALTVFDTADDAASWYNFEAQNVVAVGMSFAAAQGVSFSETSLTMAALSLGGDQAQAQDLQGIATVSGVSLPVFIDIGLIQRGPVVTTVVVVATRDQTGVLQTLAQALDANVTAALPLLGQ